jgi:hypothetical protein
MKGKAGVRHAGEGRERETHTRAIINNPQPVTKTTADIKTSCILGNTPNAVAIYIDDLDRCRDE